MNPETEPLYQSPISLGGLTLRLADMLRHVVCFGSTGVGKTRRVLIPLLRQLLMIRGDDPELKAAAILFDSKGDMLDFARKLMRDSGRTDEVLVLGDNGNCWLDPISAYGGDSVEIANFLMQTVEAKGNSRESGDEYWRENSRRLLTHATSLAKVMPRGEVLSLDDIHKAVQLIGRLGARWNCNSEEVDNADLDTLIDHLKAGRDSGCLPQIEAQSAIEFLHTDVRNIAQNTWSIVVNYSMNFLSPLLDGVGSELFRPSENRKELFSAERLIDDGRVAVINLSPSMYGPAASVYRNLVKLQFQAKVLQRNHLVFFNGTAQIPINQVRPVVYFADEFHTVLTIGNGQIGDAFFLDRAREFRCACLLGTQGISALLSVLKLNAEVMHLLNNCGTKIFMATDCPDTSEFFRRVSGNGHELITRWERRRLAPVPRFRLPNYAFAEAEEWITVAAFAEKAEKPMFGSGALKKLGIGEAYVIRMNGIIEQTTFLDHA